MSTPDPLLQFMLPRKAIKAIVMAGLLAGTLDIIAAVLNFLIGTGGSPIRVFLYIASGIFGRESFSGGTAMALWGLLFHYCIAFVWTLIFFLAYPKLPLLSRNKLLTGIIYGSFVWLVMNVVVLPLSNVPPVTFTIFRILVGIVILMFCVRVPITVLIDRYYAQKGMVASPVAADNPHHPA